MIKQNIYWLDLESTILSTFSRLQNLADKIKSIRSILNFFDLCLKSWVNSKFTEKLTKIVDLLISVKSETAFNESQWKKFCRKLEIDELYEKIKFKSCSSR